VHVFRSENSPEVLGAILADVVEEVVVEDVVFAGSLLNLVLLGHRSQVLVESQVLKIIKSLSSESFVSMDFTKRSLLVGANRHDLALVLDRMNSERKSVELGDTVSGKSLDVERLGVEVEELGVAFCVDNLAFVLAGEVDLDLLEDGPKVLFGLSKLAELPCLVSAPEEEAFREFLFAESLLSDSNVVVVLNTIDLSP